jgi:hypothetical protein
MPVSPRYADEYNGDSYGLMGRWPAVARLISAVPGFSCDSAAHLYATGGMPISTRLPEVNIKR